MVRAYVQVAACAACWPAAAQMMASPATLSLLLLVVVMITAVPALAPPTPSPSAPFSPEIPWATFLAAADPVIVPPPLHPMNSINYSLTSISTPAGSSRPMSASMVCAVGWCTSIRRWCVRVSKCSRESLFTWGERSTQ